MVTFDGRAAGTPPETWTVPRRFDALPALTIPAGRTLVVAAHPDDETLGAGGLLQALAAAGSPADVVVVTDGSASHPGSPTLSPDDLVRLRADEVTRAVALLSPASKVWLLSFPDGEVREHRDAVRDALRDLVGRAPVSAVVAPWRGDGHRDHRIVGEICAELATEAGARLLEYPIWLWHWATPDHADVPWPRMRALALDDTARVVKRRAVTAHATQVEPWSSAPEDRAPLHPAFLRHFEHALEVFVADEAVPAGLGSEFFDAAYARRADPWRLESRWYESRKRALTMAVLPHRLYASVLEVGCSVGMLTLELAARCDHLLATDVAAAAVEQAGARLADMAHVQVAHQDIRTGIPPGSYDLVVLSEVGYYLTRPELVALAHETRAATRPGGVVVACHWRHPVREHTQTGDEVHRTLAATLGMYRLGTYADDDLVLDLWGSSQESVARREGLVT